MKDEAYSSRQLVSSAYADVLEVARYISEVYAESLDSMTPELHEGLMRLRFLLGQLEPKRKRKAKPGLVNHEPPQNLGSGLRK